MNSYLNEFRSRFNELEKREQFALSGLTAFLGAVVFYLAIWTPANNFAIESKRDYERRLSLLEYIRSTESEAMAVKSGTKQTTGNRNLLTAVSRVAQTIGVNPSRMQPEGGDAVSVWFDSIAFNRLMLLLERLESSQAIVVRQISIERRDEPGTVSARVVLRN